MNTDRIYICPTHGQVPDEEVEGAEIFDYKTKELHFVLEHIPGKRSKCFRKVKRVRVESVSYENSLC